MARMAVPTLGYDCSTDSLHDEIFYTLARLNADPVASDLAPAFASRLDEFRTLAANELTLTEARLQAQAAVDQADGVLDGFVDEFAAVLLIDANKDRKSPKFRQYFGSKAVAAFKRPVLNEELDGCRAWAGWMLESGSEKLAGFAPRAKELVAGGDQALQARRSADDAARAFRLTGARRQFIDSLNALRKSTYGVLGSRAHDKGYPLAYPDGFFRHQLHAARSTPTPTLEDCDRAMADLKAQLADWQATRDELVKDQEAAAQAAAMDQSRQTALDQAKKDLAAAQARLDALGMGK